MMDRTPDIVQVVPHKDYTVSVYFCDGKIVLYDVRPKLKNGVFCQLQDVTIFVERCTIMNDTLAWDISGTRDPSSCIDIDPDVIYSMEDVDEQTVA